MHALFRPKHFLAELDHFFETRSRGEINLYHVTSEAADGVRVVVFVHGHERVFSVVENFVEDHP